MALATGITIPASFNKEETVTKNIQDVIEKLGMTIEDVMSGDLDTIAKLAGEQFKIDEESFRQEQRQFAKNQEKMDQMIQAILKPPVIQKNDLNQPWYVKMVHKSTKYWDKYVVKNKFFQKTLDLLKEGLAKAGNFLLDLMKGLLLLAIFDPNGALMSSLIDILTKGAIWLIEILAKLAPRIVDAIVVALPRIMTALWNAFWKISEAIGKAIGTVMEGVFKRLQDKFGEGPFFSLMFKLAEIFKNPAVAKAMGSLILGLGILSKLGMLGPIMTLLKAALPFVLTGLSAIGTFISSSLIPFFTLMFAAMSPLLPILLAVVAGIAALTAIFIYADEIVSFVESTFSKFFEWFNKQATWLKTIVGIVMAPIGLIIGAIYGLAKAFQFFKKEGFIKGLKLLFTKILPEMWKKISKWFMEKIGSFVEMFGEFFDEMYEKGKGIFDKIVGTIKNMFSFAYLRGIIASGIDYVFGKGTFEKISNYIIEAFSVVTDFLQGFVFWLLGKLSGFLPGLSAYEGFGNAGLGASVQAAALVRETGMDISQAGALTQAIVENDVKAKTLGKEVGLTPGAMEQIIQVKGTETEKQEQTAGILRDIRDSLKTKPKISTERAIKR